jgi:uncharacterized protein YfdQ (DUF2303 family)
MTTPAPDKPAVVPGFDATAIAALGRKAAELQVVALDDYEAANGDLGLPTTVPLVFDPATGKPLDVRALFEAWRIRPTRKRGTAKVNTLQSFTDLVDRHADASRSVVFADADWRKPSLTAVLDYHAVDSGPDLASHGTHRVHYAYPLSDEWRAWVDADGKSFEQVEFAAFLEDRIADLADPTPQEREHFEQTFGTKIATPAEVFTLARGLEVKVEARVKAASRLQDGAAQIVFEEEHRDAKGEAIRVPGMFFLQVAPFVMGAPVRLPVRLRYRVAGGSIRWQFVMFNPGSFVAERVRADLNMVAEVTGLPVFEGTPEMSA